MLIQKRLATVSLFLISTFCLLSSCPMLLAEDSLEERVSRLAQPYIENEVVVGLVVGILLDEKPSAFGYGKLSDKDKTKPDGNTVYEIGSISKVFTGVLLADAVVQGRVELSQPAAELLPDGVNMPKRGEREITLLDLTTHVSGLPRMPDNMKPNNPNNPYADYQAKDMYAFLNGHKLRRPPGEKTEYSNFGQGLLGHLLALKQKTTYEPLLLERIAKPLQMTSTSITLSKIQQAKLAPPHLGGGQPSQNWDLNMFSGAGGIRSSANDMLRFAAANLQPPKGELGKAIKLAWEIHQKPLAKGDFAMGLGWHVARDGSTRWHNGQTGGYHSMLLVNRFLNTSVVVLSNTATGEIDMLAEDIIRMLAGEKVKPRVFEKPISVAQKLMKRYEGKYELAPKVFFTVEMKDKKLMVGFTGQPTFRVFARTETEWYFKVVKATLTFHIDDSGKCDSVELFQNGERHTAKRVE